MKNRYHLWFEQNQNKNIIHVVGMPCVYPAPEGRGGLSNSFKKGIKKPFITITSSHK
jgi:hypothetical protein